MSKIQNHDLIGESEPDVRRSALVGLCLPSDDSTEVERSIDELDRLLQTAGGICVLRMIQNKDKPDPRTLIGLGKVEELAFECRMREITLVVFDTDLSPSQIRNLEDSLGDGVQVMDRSMLILDIFALHAVTGEGKLQVELAQLKYTVPRLYGHGKDLSRLGGGIGTRGPGESKLETDKRHIERRIRALEDQIAEMEKNRQTIRRSRERSRIPQVAIVGYTNAGKSTLLNRLTDAGILAEDKLFATLDPTTRKFTLPDGEEILLTDTVGFINKLPHHLVDAFRSTLEEACYADILLILSDVSDVCYPDQLKVTENLLEELGASEKPTVYCFNKCDRGIAVFPSVSLSEKSNRRSVMISARTGQGIDRLTDALTDFLRQSSRNVTFFIPNKEAGILTKLYKDTTVKSVDYGAEGITVETVADSEAIGRYRAYAVAGVPEPEEDDE